MSENENAVQVAPGGVIVQRPSMQQIASQVVERLQVLQHVYKNILQEGIRNDYAAVPGCGDRPALLKPGAEKLMMAFQVSPSFAVQRIDLGNGHREYEITTTLCSAEGVIIGGGVGCCSTMEGKYRFRTGGGELTAVEVPKKYWDTRKTDPTGAGAVLVEAARAAGVDGDKFGTKKNDAGQWVLTTHGEKVEHDNPADNYNTVLKMAKKRSLVDAVLNAFGASNIFTQDIEERMPEADAPKATAKPPVSQPQSKPAPEAAAAPPPAAPPVQGAATSPEEFAAEVAAAQGQGQQTAPPPAGPGTPWMTVAQAVASKQSIMDIQGYLVKANHTNVGERGEKTWYKIVDDEGRSIDISAFGSPLDQAVENVTIQFVAVEKKISNGKTYYNARKDNMAVVAGR